MYRNGYNRVSVIRINSYSRRNNVSVYAPTYYLDIPREMYGLMRLLRNIYSWVGQALLFWFMVYPGYMKSNGFGLLHTRGRSRARFKKGLRWIPRHPETRKGVASDEMLRELKISIDPVRRFPNRSTFRTAAESMGRQETTWRTETFSSQRKEAKAIPVVAASEMGAA
ncbi:hypothetical protein IEQ34_023317 [Dendrobium chrysotoxum]|uniref:Uncharacterized protein n=1 Tax=Dendrobium chrysotoxum TaxID=161865 RepID=A0AAV7FUW8_DENCH|nr:hypothetical protein IEQ34_023317 [Dendrobium chrysotoxum]